MHVFRTTGRGGNERSHINFKWDNARCQITVSPAQITFGDTATTDGEHWAVMQKKKRWNDENRKRRQHHHNESRASRVPCVFSLRKLNSWARAHAVYSIRHFECLPVRDSSEADIGVNWWARRSDCRQMFQFLMATRAASAAPINARTQVKLKSFTNWIARPNATFPFKFKSFKCNYVFSHCVRQTSRPTHVWRERQDARKFRRNIH